MKPVIEKSPALPPRLVSVAPMLDWSDRHCREFHRHITRHTWLYTEMVTTGSLLHGDVQRHLEFNPGEHPVALQLVADCVKAMKDAVSIDVTVKHRIGIDHVDSYEFMRDFVGQVAEAGSKTFIVHARNAILKGLSPRENREIPPLKYDYAYRLKKEFPSLEIILNGGIKTTNEMAQHLEHVDGVMIGREAYHNPYFMANFDALFYGDDSPVKTREEILHAMIPYIRRQLELYGNGGKGLRINSVIRHMLGLMMGMVGARAFRQTLSDSKKLALGNPEILIEAFERMQTITAYDRSVEELSA